MSDVPPDALTRRTFAAAAVGAALAVPAAARVRRDGSVPLALGPAEPLPGGLHGFNTYFLTATAFQGMTYDGPRFEAAVRDLRPRALRFPGGSIANNYLWRQDSFSDPKDDKTGWAGEQLRLFRKLEKEYGLAGFARVCKRYDLEPVWVLNVYEETPASVVELFGRLDDLGLKVGRVEFGNEPYWDGRSLMNVWDYIKFCRPLAAALKKSRPGVEVGACFGPVGEGKTYQADWNVPLGREDWYDAAVYHEYYGGQGFALEAGSTLPVEALLRPGALVDDAVAALDAAAPGKPIWFTEWNLGSEGVAQWKNTGAELLFIAGVLGRLVARRGRVPLACFHNIYEANFGTFYLDPETGESHTNASYQLFRLLGAAFADATGLRPVTVPAAVGDDLFGFAAAAGAGDVRLFLVNRGAADRTFTLPTGVGGGLALATIRCPPGEALPIDTPLAGRSAVTGGSVTLPGHSISLIARPAALDAVPPQTAGGENLFPRRPDLEFWHPPYAARQPRFDTDGVYTVEVAELREKEIAVLKMNLAGLKLTAGEEYALSFAAKAEPAGGAIVKLPVAGGAGTSFLVLGEAFAPRRLTFRFDPAANDGNVSFVFQPEFLKTADRAAFRDFRIGPAD